MKGKTAGMNATSLAPIVLLGALASACAATQPYVHKNVSNPVRLSDSEGHAFRFVHVTTDEDDLVVYGKVQHNHVSCEGREHVDLAVVGPAGETVDRRSILIVSRSHRVRGWHGAAFRARLPIRLADGQEVRLAIHDECATDEVFVCGANRAAP